MFELLIYGLMWVVLGPFVGLGLGLLAEDMMAVDFLTPLAWLLMLVALVVVGPLGWFFLLFARSY